jgi:hypothetical protein
MTVRTVDSNGRLSKVAISKNYGWLVVGLMACGGVDGIDDEELGQLEQGFGAKVTPTYQYGTQTGGNAQRCNKTSAGQVCRIPSTKAVQWCGAFPLPYSQDLAGVVNGFDDMSTWSFSPVGDCNFVFKNIEVRHQVDGCGTNGTASTDIKDYVCNDYAFVSGLTEGAEVVGSYESQQTCVVKVDLQQLISKGTNETQDRNFARHAFAHGIAACIGIGGRSGLVTNFASRHLMNGNVSMAVLTAGERCAAESFTLSQPGKFFNVTPACPSD